MEAEQMKAKKKLVPLMPILERLNACTFGIKRVREVGAATFQEAWSVFRHESIEHRRDICWLAYEAHMKVGDARTAGWIMSINWYNSDALDRIERRVSATKVERMLYDFAKREGLA